MIVLGIETSCDETAVALVTGKRQLLADLVLSQLKDHAPYGGVVPEIAARRHIDHLDGLIARAMRDAGRVEAIGHRVVHGGPEHSAPLLLSEGVLSELDRLRDLAPLHNGPALEVIAASRDAFPDLPQVACFDTAFHADMPAASRTYPLPAEWSERAAPQGSDPVPSASKMGPGEVKRRPKAESGAGTKPPKGGFFLCRAGSSDLRRTGSRASASRSVTAAGSTPRRCSA